MRVRASLQASSNDRFGIVSNDTRSRIKTLNQKIQKNRERRRSYQNTEMIVPRDRMIDKRNARTIESNGEVGVFQFCEGIEMPQPRKRKYV